MSLQRGVVMAMIGGSGRAPTGMVERGDVLGAVERLLNVVGEGRGGALFVVGPAGLGKTTVLEHAITMARPRFAVGVGCGDQVEAVLPFGLIGQALDPLLDGRLPGGSMALDADGGDAASISVQARFYGILRGVRQAAVRPLVVALDDLHWSDPDSLTVIHLICRRLAGLPVALIATARPWPADAVTSAQDLAAQGLAEIVALAPLSTAATRELLCSQVSGEVPVEVVGQAIELCGGNPLLVEQVAAELSRSGDALGGTGLVFSVRRSGRGWAALLAGGERSGYPISGRRRDGSGRTIRHRGRHRDRRSVPRRPAARGRGRVGAVHPCADPAGDLRRHRASGARGPACGLLSRFDVLRSLSGGGAAEHAMAADWPATLMPAAQGGWGGAGGLAGCHGSICSPLLGSGDTALG